ncbi:YppE family protein [Salsuginibacillus kocurii]|uniref:YppE family protein n=1 Tax=Salsuginibacillus kocurii TaxID=427078 RepID=UPI00037E8285|nr:YppE family protein [Salsuginibacillus kocurii]
MAIAYQDLYTHTLSLQNKTKEALDIFQRTRDLEEPPDFYEHIKPFADDMLALSDRWQEEAEQWIDKEKPVYMHKQLIWDTHENLQILSMQAFHPKTKEKRFREMIQAVDYVLNGVRQAFDEGIENKQ